MAARHTRVRSDGCIADHRNGTGKDALAVVRGDSAVKVPARFDGGRQAVHVAEIPRDMSPCYMAVVAGIRGVENRTVLKENVVNTTIFEWAIRIIGPTQAASSWRNVEDRRVRVAIVAVSYFKAAKEQHAGTIENGLPKLGQMVWNTHCLFGVRWVVMYNKVKLRVLVLYE